MYVRNCFVFMPKDLLKNAEKMLLPAKKALKYLRKRKILLEKYIFAIIKCFERFVFI